MQPAGWLFSRRTAWIHLFPIGVHRKRSALIALEPIYAVAYAEVRTSTEMFKKKEYRLQVYEGVLYSFQFRLSVKWGAERLSAPTFKESEINKLCCL